MQFPDIPGAPGASDAPLIAFHSEDVPFELPFEEAAAEWLLAVAAAEQKPLDEVNYIFCSDEHLRQINIEYLDHDYYTDVITFPYDEDSICGDIFISIDRVRDNAEQLQAPFLHELSRVMVHGVLHLAGYYDHTDEQEAAMRAKEDFYLKTAAFLQG